jgi:hypothetical protein
MGTDNRIVGKDADMQKLFFTTTGATLRRGGTVYGGELRFLANYVFFVSGCFLPL